MIGTGFVEDINKKLFDLYRSCTFGLEREIEAGLDIGLGLQREFTEIRQYLELLGNDPGLRAEATRHFLLMLRPIYAMIEERMHDGLPRALDETITSLEYYLRDLETKHKAAYGSLWKNR